MRYKLVIAAFAVTTCSMPCIAQTAGMVSFQGLIRDSGGTPIVTTVSLEFRIFTADTGGTQVDMDGDGTLENIAAAAGAGTDTILVGPLTPNGGIVSTKFGPVSPKAFAGCTPGVAGCRWLEATVVGSGPLSRIEMVTPPGAAEQVNALESGNEAIVTNAVGDVGVGTASPATKLHIAGSVRVDNSLGIGGGSDASRVVNIVKSLDGSTGYSVTNNSSNSLARCGYSCENDQGRAGSLQVLSSTAGPGFSDRVFIRSNDPGPGLDLACTGATSDIRFFTGSYPLDLSKQRMVIASNGNVGIGIANPEARLNVLGPALAQSTGTSLGGLAITSQFSPSGSFSGLDFVGSIFSHPTARIAAHHSNAGSQLSFGTSNAFSSGITNQAMTINQNGCVGIGGAPTSTVILEVAANVTDNRIRLRQTNPAASAAGGIEFANSNSVTQWIIGSNIVVGDGFEINAASIPGGNALYVAPTTGNVGIGTASPTAKLHVNGNIIASGCTGCSSDARHKRDIVTFTGALDRLLALRGVWFRWKEPREHGDESRRQMGMIAQEVEKVLPEWVMKDKDGYRYLNTTGFPALAVEAMRELKSENDELKAKLVTMESRLAQLEAALGGKATLNAQSSSQEKSRCDSQN